MSFLGDVLSWLVDGDNWSGRSGIANRLEEHVRYSVSAVVAAVAIALPLGIWLGHLRRFGTTAINVANVLYLLAYFMRDIRWLRVFTIVAAGLLAAYFYFRSPPLMNAVYWNLFFGGLNAWQLARLALEAPKGSAKRRPTGTLFSRWTRNGGRLSPCS